MQVRINELESELAENKLKMELIAKESKNKADDLSKL
jgi:hypothetical protein